MWGGGEDRERKSPSLGRRGELGEVIGNKYDGVGHLVGRVAALFFFAAEAASDELSSNSCVLHI